MVIKGVSVVTPVQDLNLRKLVEAELPSLKQLCACSTKKSGALIVAVSILRLGHRPG